MDLLIPNAFIIATCDKCGRDHAPIRMCEEYETPISTLVPPSEMDL